MSVQIQFNHHYTLDGVGYAPGDVATVTETVAAPLLYSMKAHLVGQEVAATRPTQAYVITLAKNAPVPPGLPPNTVIIRSAT